MSSLKRTNALSEEIIAESVVGMWLSSEGMKVQGSGNYCIRTIFLSSLLSFGMLEQWENVIS